MKIQLQFSKKLSILKKYINLHNLICFEYCILGILLAYVVIYQIINNFSLIQTTVVLATTIKPEKFTELYFENSDKLPNVINPGEIYNFTFTIHNLEYQVMNYSYEVYIEYSEHKNMIRKGNIQLKPNEYSSTKVFVMPNNFRSKITVNLIDKNQAISFWMDII
jgi:hypothetical protein